VPNFWKKGFWKKGFWKKGWQIDDFRGIKVHICSGLDQRGFAEGTRTIFEDNFVHEQGSRS
jgi:hypothetical protein